MMRSASGKRSRGGQLGAGVGDDDVEAERLGEAGQGLRDVDRAEDEQRRRRRKRLDEDLDRLVVPGDGVGSRFRPLARQEIAGIGLRPRRRASHRRAPPSVSSGRISSLAPTWPPRTTVATATGTRSASACSSRAWISTREWRETGHSVTGSTKTSIVPPQASPTSQAISSVMP